MSEESRVLRKLALWMGIPFLVLFALAAALIIQNQPPIVNVPTRTMPNPNGWDDFVKAGELASAIRPLGPLSNASKQPEDWTVAELQSWAAAARPALDAMRSGLTKECVQPQIRDYAASFPNYARVRELARTASSEAIYYQAIGEFGRAVDSRLDCMEMGVVMQRGGILITCLVGVACEAIGRARLEPMLAKLTPPELENVARRMEKINSERVPFGEVLTEEGNVSALEAAKMFRNLSSSWQARGVLSGGSLSTVDQVKQNLVFSFQNKAKMVSEYRDYMRALAKEQNGPYTGRSGIPVPDNAVCQLFCAVFVRAHYSTAKNEAVFALLQTEVALLRYRADHGHYPTSLRDLTRGYLKRVPVDPLGQGKPLRYHLTKNGEGYLLYSVGPDLCDSGGKLMKDVTLASGAGDIVAGTLDRKPPAPVPPPGAPPP